jgi:hypothetical protein
MSTRKFGALKQIVFVVACAIALLALPALVQAQDQEAEGLRFPVGGKTVVVRSGIGGEAHDSYVLHVREGRKLTVTIVSTGNRAQFTVSRSEFGDQVSFGKFTKDGNTWTGTVPETGVLFISVLANPSAARYTLRVTKE